MDEIDKLLIEIQSRASDALEEKEHMERMETGDMSAVKENVEELFDKVDELKEIRRFDS